jgi:hypothetical protein
MADEERTARVRARVEESLAQARSRNAKEEPNETNDRTRAAPPPATPPPLDLGDDEGNVVLGGLARIAASAAWHTGGWALGNYVRVSRRVAGAATSPTQALRLVRDVQRGAEGVLLGLVNATDVGQRVGTGPAADVARRVADAVSTGRSGADEAAHHHPGMSQSNGHVPRRTLRQEGEQLLRQSADVRFEVDAHPAYERILSELAPDEGRILRLLLLKGPQAAVDVRTGGPLGLLNSRLIAPGISMIGARAGCRYVDRVPSYLNNLFRLGLVWFSRETLRDHLKYQVLEAQPEVLDAIHSVAQAKVVRRSIHLTPFGEDFCRTCLMPDTISLAELPEHADPPEGKAAAPPIDPSEM